MKSKQQGATLIVALIMLVLLTIFAFSSFNIGRGSLQVANNAASRTVAATAAQGVINDVISAPTFTENPNNVLDNSTCPAGMAAPANSRCVQVDDKTTLNVALAPAPSCVQARPLLTSELDLSDPEEFACTQGLNQNFGVAGYGSVSSLCSDTMWEVSATARDAVTQAEAVITHGVSVRVSSDSSSTFCP